MGGLYPKNIYSEEQAEGMTPTSEQTSSGMPAPSISSVNVEQLPTHQYIPKGAKSYNHARLGQIVQNTVGETFLEWTVPEGFSLVITDYALFNNSRLPTAYFVPTVNESRWLQYHGNFADPVFGQRLYLGMTNDLGKNALVEAHTILGPRQKYVIKVWNTQTVDVEMGFRVKGYVVPNTHKVVSGGN